jgi:hypothetical protein
MDNLEEKFGKCICERCPSFVKCQEDIYFCFKGKSKCLVKEKGCICMACLIHKKAGFKKVFFCTRGKEEEQAK